MDNESRLDSQEGPHSSLDDHVYICRYLPAKICPYVLAWHYTPAVTLDENSASIYAPVCREIAPR